MGSSKEALMTDVDARPQQASRQDTGEYAYQRGFGNEFATEAVAGALPAGGNSPQRAPLGLFAEQLSGTAFTQPRAVNRRTWVYRIIFFVQAEDGIRDLYVTGVQTCALPI